MKEVIARHKDGEQVLKGWAMDSAIPDDTTNLWLHTTSMGDYSSAMIAAVVRQDWTVEVVLPPKLTEQVAALAQGTAFTIEGPNSGGYIWLMLGGGAIVASSTNAKIWPEPPKFWNSNPEWSLKVLYVPEPYDSDVVEW